MFSDLNLKSDWVMKYLELSEKDKVTWLSVYCRCPDDEAALKGLKVFSQIQLDLATVE